MPLEHDFTDSTNQATLHAQHHNDLAVAVNALRAATSSFDVSLAPVGDTTVHGELDYATASVSDTAYAVNLLLRNVRAVIDALSAAGIVTE